MAYLVGALLMDTPRIIGAVLTVTFLITALNLLRRLFSDASLPNNLPWAGVGEHSSRLGRAKANLTSIFCLPRLLDEGYAKYSKNGRTYVLPYYLNGPQGDNMPKTPGALTNQAQRRELTADILVILPPSQIPWLLEQSEDVLSQEAVNRQFLQAEYVFLHANKVADPVHPEVIHHQLTKKLGGFAEDIVDEVHGVLEETWGTDTDQWREVKVYDTILLIISRLSVRVLMGPPLCRDKTFVSICGSFIRKVALSAAAISIYPAFLKPVVGPIFMLYDYVLYRRCKNYLMPIIRARLERLRDPETAKLPLEDPSAHVRSGQTP
ncbi:hypothetical protein NUW58_g9201 [Xylaria curta]|uniref:Uncharacterized protein n=1 Tax=Xylaria curta TaxID=42375 RepID=A0ACC1MZT0_9PEZI|nr:hypothetical protein NUW58_g9201 [Xylaria curta]